MVLWSQGLARKSERNAPRLQPGLLTALQMWVLLELMIGAEMMIVERDILRRVLLVLSFRVLEERDSLDKGNWAEWMSRLGGMFSQPTVTNWLPSPIPSPPRPPSVLQRRSAADALPGDGSYEGMVGVRGSTGPHITKPLAAAYQQKQYKQKFRGSWDRSWTDLQPPKMRINDLTKP